MRRYGIVVMLILSVGIVLIGCGKVASSIRPAQVTAISNSTIQAQIAATLGSKQDEIEKALEKILPPAMEFVVPKKAGQKQSIYVEDTNKDGKLEAFTLYRNIRENKQVHLLVLQNDNGNWIKLTDVATSFNNLDYFRLEDLDGNGNKEVIVGVSTSDSEPRKQFLIYELDGRNLVKKVDRTYEWVDILDLNEDKKPDILILDSEKDKLQTVEMFSYEKGQLQFRSLVNLDPDGDYENIVSGKLADGKKALFIDSGVGAHSMLTEIVTYNNGKLIKVGDEKGGVPLKAYPLYSKDINNDGIIEVGGMYIPKGFEEAAMAEIPFIYTYTDYSTNGTKQIIQERYTDSCQHFYIIIPSKWYGKVTIKKFDKGVQLVSDSDQKILFDIKWINKESYLDSNKKLRETKDTIFYTDMKDELSIPKDNFHLLEDEF